MGSCACKYKNGKDVQVRTSFGLCHLIVGSGFSAAANFPVADTHEVIMHQAYNIEATDAVEEGGHGKEEDNAGEGDKSSVNTENEYTPRSRKRRNKQRTRDEDRG